jgi:antitoxin VapB
MAITKVFKNGNSQSVRIPKEYRLEVDEVEIVRVDDSLVLRPVRRGLGRVLELFASFSDEVLDERHQPPVQTREGL